MSLSPGTRVGSFVIVSLIGEGGMGEVYRARDERLGRDVAIKILPAAFTRDVARLDRFEREARVLASLNHPNIAAIYGVEGGPADAEHQFALVLELVEGETLAERIGRRGALPADEALAIARQIADALDAAHEKGIVHRDLKPANIKVTPDDVVKVLDFGLAKAIGGSDPYGSLDATVGSTHEGVVLGTAAYMSPEQARAQPVDKRTDIWAFGCVLYEMLAGRPAFHAATMSDTIARILGGEPDWTALPADIPAGVRQLLERCLERDTKGRLRDVGDLSLALSVPGPEATAPPARRRLASTLAAIVATAAVAALAATALTRSRATPAEAPAPVRFEIPLSVRLPPAFIVAVSPDGRRIALAGATSGGSLGLWIRPLETLEIRPIGGTEGHVRPNSTLFWSPDGRSIGFYADGVIKRVDSDGGVPQDVCRVPGVSVGGTWNRDGVIVVGNTNGGLLRCPARSGEASAVTVAADTDTLHLFPSFLPDGQHLLYLRISRSDPSINGLYIADLERAPAEQSGDRLLGTGFGAALVASDRATGHILFVRDQAVFAVPFDTTQRKLAGDPVQVAAPVGTFRDGAFLSATPTLLTYRGPAPDVRLQWRGRTGTELGQVGEPGAYSGLALSPGATRVAVLRESRQSRADQDIWLLDLTRETMTPFAIDPQMESPAAWSHDERALLYAVGHGTGDVMLHPLDGSPPQVLLEKGARPEFRVNPLLTTMHASADGRVVVFSAEGPGRAQSDLWVLSLVDGAVAPLVRQDFTQTQGTTSPDGAWLAYVSDESGVNEVFVRPLTTTAGSTLPTAGPPTVVSRGGGNAPRWRGNSRELFYQSPAGGVMAVPISPSEVGRPAELFRVPGLLPYWDVTRDGDRFLLALPVTPGDQVLPTAVLNWQAGLAR